MQLLSSLPDFQWFRLFYLLAIALGAALVLRAARRDGLPVSAALGLFLFAALFGVLGSRLAELPPAAWWEVLRTGRAMGEGKTMLGGIAGTILGLALGRRILGIGSSMWGWFAGWPAVLILFRMGCLTVGCCIGAATELPWGMEFAAHSPACHSQISQGLLSADAAHSLAAHPVPVYEILFAVAMLMGMQQLSKRNWNANSLFFLSLASYFGFRFVEEFIRVEHPVATGLNAVQWAMLAAMPLAVGFLLYSRRRVPGMQPHQRPDWVLALASLAVILLLHNFWTTAEFMALGGLMLAYGMLKGFQFLRAEAAARMHLRWVAPASMLAGVLLMSQAAIDQTVSADSSASAIEIGMGVAMGRYQETCGDNHKYAGIGAGAQYTKNWGGKHQLDLGARAFYANDDDNVVRLPVYGGNPFVAYQNRWVGIEVGAAVGNLLTNGQRRTVLPAGALRIGPSDLFFVEGRVVNNSAFMPVPGSAFRVGIGSGFGMKNGTVFRLGFGMDGIYLNPSIVIKKNYVLEPMLAIGDHRSYLVGLGARMRLGL